MLVPVPADAGGRADHWPPWADDDHRYGTVHPGGSSQHPARLLGEARGAAPAGFALLHTLTRTGALADVRAAMDHVLAQPGVDEVAMIGFSAGGHLAYLAASQLPIGRTVVLYGGWLPTTDIPLSRPEPTLTLTSRITGRVLYLVGSADALIDAVQREQIRAALDTAGIDHELVSYPGVQHAYFWPGTPGFDEAATRDSWNRILWLPALDGA